MYQYDEYDQRIVDERAKQFRNQVERRLDGDIEENEFKPLRLQNGLYMQLHAYMLRVAVPYGLMSSKQFRMMGHIARTYDKGYAHFTTRQNVQFNWPTLENVPNILDDLASVQMHAIQTSGNCIRNTTSDHLAGVARDELVDPRPYCEIIRQWSTFHPEFAFLPRKFKIAVTGTPDHDRAAIRFHDIGVRLVKNEAGEIGCQVWAGGGLGRTPVVARVVREWVAQEDLLSYLEAILRVYNQYGNRDQKYKARIKILVNTMKIENFRAAVDAEWEQIREGVMKLTQAELDRVSKQFAPPALKELANADNTVEGYKLGSDRAFGAWVKSNVTLHRQDGYASAVLSLKAPGNPPGDASDTQLDAMADLADEYSFGELVVLHTQDVLLPHVEISRLPELFEKLKPLDLAGADNNAITGGISCPGLDFCVGQRPVDSRGHGNQQAL